MKFIHNLDKAQKQTYEKKLVADFEKSLDLSTIDSLDQLEKVFKKMLSFQEKHKNIRYVEWIYNRNTSMYLALESRILPQLSSDNHLSILKDIIKVMEKKDDEEEKIGELYYKLFCDYYCKRLEDIPNIDDETLRYCFNKGFNELHIVEKIFKIYDRAFYYFTNKEEILIERIKKIFKKEDIVFAIEHYCFSTLKLLKFINSNLVDGVLREVGVYDVSNKYLEPLYLKVPLKLVPYDLLKTETIEYMLTHIEQSGFISKIPTGRYVDIHTDIEIFNPRKTVWDTHEYLEIDTYIADFCLKKANAGECKLLDMLLDCVISVPCVRNETTDCEELFKIINEIQDKEYRQKIMDKYGIVE